MVDKVSLEEMVAAEAVGRVADFIEAMGIDRNEVARALLIEAVARGRNAAGDDEWIGRLSAITSGLAEESAECRA